MITTYEILSLPLGKVLELAVQAPDGLAVHVTMVRALARRAVAEIAVRDARIDELESLINQLKGEKDAL